MSEPKTDALDAVAVPVFVLEPDEFGVPRFVSWNGAAEFESGLSRTDVIGRTARDIFPGQLGREVFDHHMRAMLGKKTTCEFEVPSAPLNKWFRTTLEPQCRNDESVWRIVGTTLDISNVRRVTSLENSLLSANCQMEQFITLAAHDLRTPMRNITILTEILRDGFEDRGDGKLELINLLEETAVKAGGLITEVLNHAENSNLAPVREQFDFGHLCQTLSDVLDPCGVNRIGWPKSIVVGDKVAFQIVLRNLIDNAIKHSGKPNVQIDITIEQASAEQVTVWVKDDGCGFENPGRVFLETGSFRNDSGYGLLSVSRLLTARGGKIHVTKNDQGGRISFSLPGVLSAHETAPRVDRFSA